MPDTTCLECGTRVAPMASPEGLCPRCLLAPPLELPSLDEGAQLGPYLIVSAPQSGAMGEVYRAHDRRLDRIVAIKVLAYSGLVDDDARVRFAREARLIAGLNHPHICAVYDVGQQDSLDFIVMEFLDGETLADRLARGPLPLREVARYGAQIAAALSAVHRRGIVHHDLKPANVMITRSGAKLLDFGVARLRDEFRAPAAGGTPHYAAPEALRGEPDDPRSDIYALGLVLSEMADEPMPAGLARVVEHCLHADADERWQTAHDVALQLESMRAESMPVAGPVTPSGVRAGTRAPWIVAAAVLASIAVVAVASRWARPDTGRSMRLQLSEPEPSDILPGLAISPDGRKLLWSTAREGQNTLWLQDLAEAEPTRLAGTGGVIEAFPFWSPDSRRVAFFAEGQLKAIDVTTGAVGAIAPASIGHGGAWSKSGTIVYAPDMAGPLYRVPDRGGQREPATTLDRAHNESSHGWPVFLPDGRHFIYLAWSRTREDGVAYVGSLDSTERVRLMPAEAAVLYAPPGYLLSQRGGTLSATPFDARTLRVTGDPVALTRGPASSLARYPVLSVSSTGQLTYTTFQPAPRRLTWFDRTGQALGAIGPPGLYRMLMLSPNGRRLAVTQPDARTENAEIIEIDLASQAIEKMMPGRPVSHAYAVWAPDSKHMAYMSRPGGRFEVVRGSMHESETEVLARSAGLLIPFDWSADGRLLFCTVYDATTKFDIGAIPLDGSDRTLIPIVKSRFNDGMPRLSPDQRWLAFSSDESGRFEIFVQRFPNPATRWQVSANGGEFPAWRADGRELFFVSSDLRLMAVSFDADRPEVRRGTPHPLFTLPMRSRTLSLPYAATPDGQRFIVNVQAPNPKEWASFLVLNWPDLLRP